jgi:RecJ-like exonuclease
MEFDGPAIKCFSCKGKGRVSYSSALSCVRCRGIGAVEKDKGGDAADIMRKRLGEITKRLRWTRKETKKKTKEIEKRLKPIKSFVKEVSARGGSAFGGKKESQWLEKLVNKIKKG